MKTDILYCIGGASRWRDNELRYSLRSLDKYASGIRQIYLVGTHIPDWIDREKVKCLMVTDKFDQKAKNIQWAVEQAIMHFGLTDDFLLSSDDHFLCAPTDFSRESYPYYYKFAYLPDQYVEVLGKVYCEHLQDTRKLLEKYGKTFINFAHHCNTWISPTAWRSNMELMNEAYETQYGCELTCLSCNLQFSASPFKWQARNDIKIEHIRSKQDFKSQIAGASCFSIADEGLHCGLGIWIAQMYPKKSQYEL